MCNRGTGSRRREGKGDSGGLSRHGTNGGLSTDRSGECGRANCERVSVGSDDGKGGEAGGFRVLHDVYMDLGGGLNLEVGGGDEEEGGGSFDEAEYSVGNEGDFAVHKEEGEDHAHASEQKREDEHDE